MSLTFTYYKEADECWPSVVKNIISNRLFVNEWRLRLELNCNQVKQAVLCMDYGKPVACFTISCVGKDYYGSCFVRKAYRRQGIGKRLYLEMMKHSPPDFTVGYGVKGSREFWDSLGAEMYN